MKLKISGKCSDMFVVWLEDENGTPGAFYSGYVPDWMPGQHFGDYVELEVDPETGQILNWDAEAVAKAIERGLK
jgi:hypothetical protein